MPKTEKGSKPRSEGGAAGALGRRPGCAAPGGQYRSSPGSEATARLRGRAPILAAVEALLAAIDARSQTHPINASGGVQLQMQDYPREAVREIVVNGLVHRDYELNGELDIEHAPESLAITSPGGLVFGVTPDNILTHPSTPRE